MLTLIIFYINYILRISLILTVHKGDNKTKLFIDNEHASQRDNWYTKQTSSGTCKSNDQFSFVVNNNSFLSLRISVRC